MAGFMKNAMSYLGMSDVVDDEDDYIEEDEEQKPASKSAFDSDRCGRSRGISHRGLLRRRGVRRAWFPRACHSARVPVEPGAGEHQGRRADKTSLGTRFVR